MHNQLETRQTSQTATTAAVEGLMSQEAAERLQAFLKKFWGPVPWMLELAIMLELVLGRQTEAIIIVALLLFNALLGFSQETRAQRALALLHQRLAIQARVRRDGRWQVLSAADLVPEDVVHLRMGDVVPADLRLTDGQILVDQSTLTGESLPMERGVGGAAYAGALIRRGEASGVVTAMDVLCIDKTGTITQNRLSVEALQAFSPTTEDEVLRLAALASDEATQDPLDLAILEAARQRTLLASLPERLRFVPFDPSTKRSEALVRQADQVVRVVKGAPTVIAELVGTPWSDLEANVGALSAKGYRVLAVADGSETAMGVVGLIALGDPPAPGFPVARDRPAGPRSAGTPGHRRR